VTLQELCAERGLTLAALAERAGVPVTIVAKIDAGSTRGLSARSPPPSTGWPRPSACRRWPCGPS